MNTHTRERQRVELLQTWKDSIEDAARDGALTGDARKPIAFVGVNGRRNGPRAAALEIDAGGYAGEFMRIMLRDGSALLRQFIPWDFQHDPACYWQGRLIRLECAWPDELAEKHITIGDLNDKPYKHGHWLAGKSESGRAVIGRMDDMTPHHLIAGTTGSGKSVALAACVLGLSQRGDLLVLIDGKYGSGLHDFDRLPGAVGPVAVSIADQRAALAWAMAEMVTRYERFNGRMSEHDPWIAVVIDEVQEISNDPACAEMIRRIAAQGRAARVGLIVATQHPLNAAMGDATVKRNMSGRFAFLVTDPKSSEVAIGQATPRADWLLGAGDGYDVTPKQIERFQGVFISDREVGVMFDSSWPRIPTWPAFSAESMGTPINVPTYSAQEIAISMVNAADGRRGRPALQKLLESFGLGKPGNVRADRLLHVGRDVLDVFNAAGCDCVSESIAACLPNLQAHTPDDLPTPNLGAGAADRVYVEGRQAGTQNESEAE